jgi:hypothetical protein
MEYYDLPPDERAYLAEKACERSGSQNFFDLPPEERAVVYEQVRED